MRASIRASRNRILAIAASVLLFGSALAAAAMSAAAMPAAAMRAQAAQVPAVSAVTVSPIADQNTNPLSTPVQLAIGATDTDATGLPLTFTMTPAIPGLTITPVDSTDATITGTITQAGVYPVTVTATDQNGVAGSAAFTWTAGNTVKVTATAPKKVYLRIKVGIQPIATDSDTSQTLTWSVSPQNPLPPGLSINSETGLITGRPQELGGSPTTVVIATDSAGSTGSATLHWAVSTDGYLGDPGKQFITVGEFEDLSLSEGDYVPGDKMTWQAVNLPAGMGINQSPLMIYGWPARAGSQHVTINGNGSLGAWDTMTFSLVVKPATGKGPTGQIHLALDGKCLQDPGSKTANGTHVAIGNCASGAAELWTVASDGTIRVNGHCLDIAGAGSVAGSQLQLWSCGNADPRQRLLQGTDGELVNPESGLCVTDPGASENNGTVPVMSACHVKSAEQWTLPAQPILTSVGGSCADDHFSEGGNGAVVDMFWCNGSTGQAWSFRPDGTIRAGLYSNKCVTVRGKLGTIGAKVVLWACSAGDTGQRWTVSPSGRLSSELSLGGVCLGLTGMTAPNATQLVTDKCSASDPRVHWHIW